eukprot:SAG31_NODE_380_length_16468_cov_8.328548_7_plen_201_part_00
MVAWTGHGPMHAHRARRPRADLLYFKIQTAGLPPAAARRGRRIGAAMPWPRDGTKLCAVDPPSALISKFTIAWQAHLAVRAAAPRATRNTILNWVLSLKQFKFKLSPTHGRTKFSIFSKFSTIRQSRTAAAARAAAGIAARIRLSLGSSDGNVYNGAHPGMPGMPGPISSCSGRCAGILVVYYRYELQPRRRVCAGALCV